METLLSRYRNVCILVAVLFAQMLGLAIQVRRTADGTSTRLIRVWVVGAITPFEKAIVWLQNGTGGMWKNYVYLRGVRQENRDLKREIEQLRLERVRLSEDAEQARRLQALLVFKEQFIAKTVAAQVIGWSGTERSRTVYIDKGEDSGLKPDMPVITAQGVVGKLLHVYGSTSQVLLINDQSSGVGAILEKSRVQGVLRGTAVGGVILEKVMSDEQVQTGEIVRTSGGDQIFPKGLPAGVVSKVSRTPEAFLNIEIKPSANLSQLEEVLVITEKDERVPSVAQDAPQRAADILARRLPSVPEKAAEKTPPEKTTLPATDAANRTVPPAAKPRVETPAPAVPENQPARVAAPPVANQAPVPAPENPVKESHAPAVVKVSDSAAKPAPQPLQETKTKPAAQNPDAPPSEDKPQ